MSPVVDMGPPLIRKRAGEGLKGGGGSPNRVGLYLTRIAGRSRNAKNLHHELIP